VFIEDYLLMCQPAADLRQTQFGWSGETSWGFAARMDNDALRFHPTVITTCFGMNDGGYSPMTPDKAQRYRDNQRQIVEKAKQAKVRAIVVGSPGCVDADTYHHKPSDAEIYNKTLAAERDIAREVAQSEGVAFADVFDPMVEVMTKAKAKYGQSYHLAGGDGVHPDRNGHLVMAYAFLKALGCSGDIGRITVDLKANKAEATEGHKVVACRDGVVELESTRYPFCFYGDPSKTSATSGVIEFFLQSRPEPPDACRQGTGRPVQSDLGKDEQGVLGRAALRGRQPRRGVPRKPVLRAVSTSRERDPQSTELRDAAGQKPAHTIARVQTSPA
jgi:lysophospholipase L1-like esterase